MSFLRSGVIKQHKTQTRTLLQKSTNNVRVGIVHNPSELAVDEKSAHFLPRVVAAALESQPPVMAKTFITKLLKEEHLKAVIDGDKTLDDLAVHVSNPLSH